MKLNYIFVPNEKQIRDKKTRSYSKKKKNSCVVTITIEMGS